MRQSLQLLEKEEARCRYMLHDDGESPKGGVGLPRVSALVTATQGSDETRTKAAQKLTD